MNTQVLALAHNTARVVHFAILGLIGWGGVKIEVTKIPILIRNMVEEAIHSFTHFHEM